jgi:hypothetical protein
MEEVGWGGLLEVEGPPQLPAIQFFFFKKKKTIFGQMFSLRYICKIHMGSVKKSTEK